MMVTPFCFLVVRLVGEIKIQKKRFLVFALFCVPIGRRMSKTKKIKAFLVFGFRRPDWTIPYRPFLNVESRLFKTLNSFFEEKAVSAQHYSVFFKN